MPSPPAPKRRRVDSLGIHKPFVSPLKRNLSATADQATTTTPKASARVAAPQAPTTPYTPLRSSNLKTSTPLSRQANHDPEVLQAQQHLRALESQIRSLRSQNSILQQALDITTVTPTSPNPTPRLATLEQKWRKASQQAAEEVFCSFSQSIKDNGGYTAFLKQRQSKSKNFFEDEQEMGDENNEEEWRDEDGDCLTERGKRQRREEIEAKKHEKEAEVEAEEEEEELTLGSMLQVLNIPPEIIGWDTKTQAWK
ncbi:hypothetical protein KCU71_g12070, partial [Aureobasidium melanogenum]